MTSPLLLDQLAAQHRTDLLAEMRRPLPRIRTTRPLTPHAPRLLLALRSALTARTTVASSSRSGQVCCA